MEISNVVEDSKTEFESLSNHSEQGSEISHNSEESGSHEEENCAKADKTEDKNHEGSDKYARSLIETNTGSVVYAEKSTDNENVNTDDCVVMTDLNDANKNRYLVNPYFNHNLNVPSQSGPNDLSDQPKNDDSLTHQSWLPSILKGENWPDENSDFISEVINGNESIDNDPLAQSDILNHPLLSMKDTVLWKNDTQARDAADWKKYKEDDFFKMINNDKLKNFPSTQSTIPNTFANKFKNIRGLSNPTTGTPDSPLKLFGVNQNTYTKFMMNNMLNQLSPKKTGSLVTDEKIPKVMKQSDELFNKILTTSTSSGSLKNKIKSTLKSNAIKEPETHNPDIITNNTSTNDTNQSNHVHDDVTSDAEEFSSFPSTTRKMVFDGDQLFENIREGYKMGQLPITDFIEPYTQSDYTSAQEEEEEEEEKRGRGEEEELKRKEEENSAISRHSPRLLYEEISIEKLRNELTSNAEIYNAEFNVSPPKLQSRFEVANEDRKENVNVTSSTAKHKGLNFIPADEYKNKIYDKRLGKYVPTSEYTSSDAGVSSSYSTDLYTPDGFLENVSDVNKTGNSILRTAVSPSKGGVSFLDNEISSNTDNLADYYDHYSNETLEADNKKEEETETTDEAIADSFTFDDKLLISAINDSYPVDLWNRVGELDISGYKLHQITHLDQMVPNLWYLNASDNFLEQNFGIPSKVQFLDLSFNKFSSISAKFDKFQYLQILDLNNNGITDLRCLKELKSLTNLNVSFNKITNIDYLEEFKMLHYLNLSNNNIKGTLDFRRYTLWFLEDLILDNNDIDGLLNIVELPRLVNLSASNNNIRRFVYCEQTDSEGGETLGQEETSVHTSMRRICLSSNRLDGELDLRDYPKLKEILLDQTHLRKTLNLPSGLEKIASRFNKNGRFNDNLLRESLQSSSLRSLYLTGGRLLQTLPPLKGKISSVSILDLSAMNLRELPAQFGEFFPFLVDLNLNFNQLRDLRGLESLKHLRQLKLLGNEIEGVADVVEHTCNTCMSLRLVDLRANPITNNFYPFVFYDDDDDDDFDHGQPIDDRGVSAAQDEGEDMPNLTHTSFRLHDKDDIEAFSVEFGKLYENRGIKNWAVKNSRHQRQLSNRMRRAKDAYMMEMFASFQHLKYLDGVLIHHHLRRSLLKNATPFA